MRRLSAVAAVCCTLMLTLTLPACSRAADTPTRAKKTVTAAADLPVFTYKCWRSSANRRLVVAPGYGYSCRSPVPTSGPGLTPGG